MNFSTSPSTQVSYEGLQPIAGLIGPRDLTMEEYREYLFGGVKYTITGPLAYYYREGGATHRVVTADGVVHCVPAPGEKGCVLRWKNKDLKDPVSY